MSATPLAVDSAREDFSEDLARVAPFKNLAPAVVKAVSDIAEERRYRAGETIFALGQFDGCDFFFVREGRLKASCADSAGSMLIEEFGQGEFFALADALASEENPRAEALSLNAEEDSRVLAIDARAFRAVAAQRPTLTRNLMQFFAEALARSGQRQAPTESSPQRRIFAALMEYIERDVITGDWRVQRMPKHRELAERAGAAEADAANAVAQLILQGVARRDYPGLVIVDMSQLNRLAS